MMDDVDTNKVVRQHLEMEEFFTGFVIKGRETVPIDQRQTSEGQVGEAPADLEAIATEVRACRKCDLGSQRTNAVPGEGHPKARWSFLSDYNSVPFVIYDGTVFVR